MPESNKVALAVEGLECVRNDRKLFSNLNFSLESGEALLVEGANGSGKTSLLRILCGLSLPNEGRVLWCGQNIEEERTEYLSELIYIGHHVGIKDDLTALENLRIAEQLGRPRTNITAADALITMGLAEHAQVACRVMSAGQRRRVALAKLCLLNAHVWILDEPLTALDLATVDLLEHMLVEHLANGGMLVTTTHRGINLRDAHVISVKL